MPPPSGSRRVFGQAMGKAKRSSYQRQFGGKGKGNHSKVAGNDKRTEEDKAQWASTQRRIHQQKSEQIDKMFGYEQFEFKNSNDANNDSSETRDRRGWLFNMSPTTKTVSEGDARSESSGSPERAGLDLFFWTPNGQRFKSTVLYRPYFYILPSFGDELADNLDTAFELVVSSLLRKFDGQLYNAQVVLKTDLDQPNHLSPSKRQGRPMFKLMFNNVQQLMEVRKQLKVIIEKNQAREKEVTFQDPTMSKSFSGTAMDALHKEPFSCLVDMREYDVPYVVRVCTDLNIRVGTWYTVTVGLDETGDEDEANDNTDSITPNTGGVTLSQPDNETKADPTFFAFDIECTKPPLKFPSAEVDEIFMISYMVSTSEGPKGYLVVSRSVVSQDVDDFEYTPLPKYPGPFHIFNEPDEKSLLKRFFEEYRRHTPQIVVTYNGDFFDWPFVDARAKHHGMDMFHETGIEKRGEEYLGRCSVHLDAFHWVQRDSYLPQGSQGLKAVTKYKLGYDPVEVDPEDMVRFAQERPVHMASYSVSDAVATYYLYEKYVHLFIFSLCTIIPLGPEDVLRKGSGTLCETLLMVQACEKDIICPNKQVDPLAKFHKGHLLESETYIGGKVECLETGVYRSDIEYDFDLKPTAFQQLIDNIDRDLNFAIEVEGGMEQKDVVNYDEIRSEIVEELELLRDRPKRVEKPYVYHLDVGAMYPNIILTNRLQPSAMVNDTECAACDFNQAKNGCKRRMDWVWRGDYNPASKNDYERTKDQLAGEQKDGVPFHKLEDRDKATMVSTRLKAYARMAYKKTKVTEEVTRKDVVCMRENDFYVETVRRFRDRRYELKKLTKTWKKRVGGASDAAAKKEAEDRTLVYDSLQVAHKCILNSFYGYVMRKGARWRSMEMAGIVTKTGADLITQARILVEQIGRPLELDTDGIWCILPKSFPDVYTFKLRDGSKIKLEYPCVMLNADVHANFTNHQYQTVKDPNRGTYETKSECSIFFEVDGPYRCMVLPASTEEGKLLKKRYAVFNFDGSLAELKGFELKRRGELELIKTFQGQVFERFLDGQSLEECYASVADIANHWIDVLDTQGESLDDEELIDLISENRNMSRQLEDYGDQKGTSQTTARRLGEFLGSEIIKDKGLNCKFIIAEQPYGAPVTERAIPTAIWKSEPAVMKHYLRKWLKSPGMDGDAFDIRNILDWEYYKDRLGKTIQKIITIPAALQKVSNPVPRIQHPAWLSKKVSQLNDRLKQQTITNMFKAKAKVDVDIEDIGTQKKCYKRPIVHSRRRQGGTSRGGGANKVNEETPNKPGGASRVELSKEKESFGAWLEQKKALWREKRRDQKRLRSSADAASGASGGSGPLGWKRRKTSSMEGFVRDAAKAITQSEWQLIELHQMTSDDKRLGKTRSSGEMVAWIMTGKNSLQKVYIAVPRIVYLTAHHELENQSSEILSFKRVDKNLPRGRTAPFTYEVIMPEYIFRDTQWTRGLKPVNKNVAFGDCVDCVFETGVPLMNRALSILGSVSRVDPTSASAQKGQKSFSLLDLSRVERPLEGDYLHPSLSFKRIFFYFRFNASTKVGLVAVFAMSGGSGAYSVSPEEGGSATSDITQPSQNASLDVSAKCHFWIIKPGAKKGQKAISAKHCEKMFTALLETIHGTSADDNDYACVSPHSICQAASLNFVENLEDAYKEVNGTLNECAKSNNGPTFLLLNSGKPVNQLRRFMPALSSFPAVPLPFPPGPTHEASMSTLPSLNWEQPAVHCCLEALLYMNVVSWPNRVSYARYGQIPVGNLGEDQNISLYDVSLSRVVQKNRTLSWGCPLSGKCDMGLGFLPGSDGGYFPSVEACAQISNQDELWSEDDELVSPVIRRQGCYRSVCVDIDVHDIAIAALSETQAASASAMIGPGGASEGGLSSPTSVALFDAAGPQQTRSTPLGDEMSTSVSLATVRALVNTWLRDAFSMNSVVADELLHHIYRFVSHPDTLMHDPALHRVIHSLMKSTFLRLLGELQRLGCTIVHATFHKITVATNKRTLSEAEEYIDFVISTIRGRSQSGDADSLSRVALRPRQFHTHFLFLDEYNYGTMHLERYNKDDELDADFVIADENPNYVIVPSVVTAWSVIHYLGSELAQEYFRVIIGRFSREVLRKEMDLVAKESSENYTRDSFKSLNQRVVEYKKKVISKHFAVSLTKALSEILQDGVDPEQALPFLGPQSHPRNPGLEFIKNVIVVLELDRDVGSEVQRLKRSLLAQVGVAEYSRAAHWVNPCPTFILPDVFCSECHESRDVNLCYIPPPEDDEELQRQWLCEDCGSPYDVDDVEDRLINIANKKLLTYQLQDIRDRKTKRVVTRCLPKLAECATGLTPDTSQEEARASMELLHNLADFHDLSSLKQKTENILGSG